MNQKNQPIPENVVLFEIKHRFADNKRTFYSSLLSFLIHILLLIYRVKFCM